jgi:hypothetical protein
MILHQNKDFALSFFFLEFFLAQKSSLDRAPRLGEGRVIELLVVWMTPWLHRQSTSFGIYVFSMKGASLLRQFR